ncbi:MAG: hypothetical protein NKF70_13100 [Methanobacterium sp. ERen5]|nr:MAG: hypothetical protein NKF70_13100 [Methanobacterium sp. ERen5]
MKNKKIMIIFILFGMVAATLPACSAEYDAIYGLHMDVNDQNSKHVHEISVYHGDSSKIKAEVWWDGHFARWDTSTTDVGADVYMNIYDENGKSVYTEKDTTNAIGNAYFHTPSDLPVGKYGIHLEVCDHQFSLDSLQNVYFHASSDFGLVVLDPVNDNPNSGIGYWSINTNDAIQGQHNQSMSAYFVNTTRMANYKNQTPNKNSDLKNITYAVLDGDNNVVKNGSVSSLKLVNNQIGSNMVVDTSDLKPGTYTLQIQFQGNNFIKSGNVGKSFTVYPKDSSLSVSNESTLNVTQGSDAQVIAWINNNGLSNLSANNAPKANVTFTVFDQNYNVITGDTFPATLVDGHYVAYLDWNTANFKPGTYKVHMAVNGNPCLTNCDTWTNITIQPKNL